MIRLLIVDDHAIVREGLQTLLADEPDFELVGEAPDGHTALSQAERLAAHWGIELTRIEGSHIVPFGRKDAFRTFLTRVTAG